MHVNPEKFGLPPRTKLEKTGRNHYSIVIDRKSRIILKDGISIVKKAQKIKELVPGVEIQLSTTAPVCSKVVSLLGENGIEIINKP